MAEGEDPLLLLLLVVVLVAATLRPGEVAVRGSDGVRLAAAVVVVFVVVVVVAVNCDAVFVVVVLVGFVAVVVVVVVVVVVGVVLVVVAVVVVVAGLLKWWHWRLAAELWRRAARMAHASMPKVNEYQWLGEKQATEDEKEADAPMAATLGMWLVR